MGDRMSNDEFREWLEKRMVAFSVGTAELTHNSQL